MQYIHIRSTDEEDAFHVAYNQTRIVQKFDSESLEIVLMQYSKGTGFFIESTQSGKAFESYLILAGCCQLSGTDTILHTGDLLIISELDEFLHVRMLEEVHRAGLDHPAHPDARRHGNPDPCGWNEGLRTNQQQRVQRQCDPRSDSKQGRVHAGALRPCL